MAIRKGHKVNIKANVNTTKTDSIFLDLKEDTTVRVRFLPPASEDGALFTKVVNHFRLKTEDNPPRGMAVACNKHFKDESCFMCDLSKVLKRDGDKAEKAIGDDIRPSPRFYAPVLVAEKGEDGEWSYYAVKLIGLPKTAVADITTLLVQQDMASDDLFCEIETGQDVLVSRTGKGFQTRYKAGLTGIKSNLDEVYPTWEEKFIDDVEASVGLTFLGADEQRIAAVRTFGDDLDWDALKESYNL